MLDKNKKIRENKDKKGGIWGIQWRNSWKGARKQDEQQFHKEPEKSGNVINTRKGKDGETDEGAAEWA
jgi:hypothetical protein